MVLQHVNWCSRMSQEFHPPLCSLNLKSCSNLAFWLNSDTSKMNTWLVLSLSLRRITAESYTNSLTFW